MFIRRIYTFKGGNSSKIVLPPEKSSEGVCVQESNQGPVVQSVVSLTSSLVVKMLILLVSTISNSQVLLLKKEKKLLQIFSTKILAYMPY